VERNYTDGLSHVLGHLRSDESRSDFDTPSLRFVASTAPYFHDGRYATLHDVLTDPRHRMGHVESLTNDDARALEAYLRTL
jgi:cytochrome c peroxidase